MEQEIFLKAPKTITVAISEVKKKTSMNNYEGRVFSRIVRDFFKKYPPIGMEITELKVAIQGKDFHPDKALYRIVSKSFLLTSTVADWLKSPETFSGDYRTID